MEQDIPEGLGIADAAGPRPEGAREVAGARRPRGPDRGLDAETRRRIGRSLRVLYAGLLAQPIPERFQALVAEFVVRSEEESSR